MTQEGVKPSTSPSSSTGTEHPRQPDEDARSSTPESKAQTPEETSAEDGSGDDLSRCPICQFIEAGECKQPHQDWVACRNEAKAAGKDYIEECQDYFKSFLQCAIDHRDYYEPFLEMLGGLPEEDEGQEEGQGQAREGEQVQPPADGAQSAHDTTEPGTVTSGAPGQPASKAG